MHFLPSFPPLLAHSFRIRRRLPQPDRLPSQASHVENLKNYVIRESRPRPWSRLRCCCCKSDLMKVSLLCRGLVPPREAKYSTRTNDRDPSDQFEAMDGLPLTRVCWESIGQKQGRKSATGILLMMMTYITHAHAEYNLGNNKRKGRVTTMQSRPFIEDSITCYYILHEVWN